MWYPGSGVVLIVSITDLCHRSDFVLESDKSVLAIIKCIYHMTSRLIVK